jgi:hypothetical protein
MIYVRKWELFSYMNEWERRQLNSMNKWERRQLNSMNEWDNRQLMIKLTSSADDDDYSN